MTSQPQPLIGIFWLLEGRLIVDTSTLSDAEPYGDCLTHRNSHIDFWTEQQRIGTLPQDIEYEESPRGRVTYDTKLRTYCLLADRCILKDQTTVARIMRAMHLPVNIIVDTDPHYICPGCNRSESQREQDEADWDF